jgi:Predicted nucleotide-binding protein containing TIR-like domain
MPARRSSRSTPRPAELSPQLTVARGALGQQLEDRIARGQELLERPIASDSDLSSARSDYYTWSEFNETLLQRSFTTSKPAEDYSESLGAYVVSLNPEPLPKRVEEFHRDVQRKIRRLGSLREQLSLFEEPAPAVPARPEGPSAEVGTTVFVVHGHGEAFKQEVARFLDAVTELEPVILHEQANSGRTIIEKFEDHASRAAFAVILLTGDDDGGVRGSGERNPRARQNVVFELGFFIAALGRSKVAALYEEGVELPSDMSGVLYTPLDAGGAWKLALGKELRAVDLPVDLNRAM